MEYQRIYFILLFLVLSLSPTKVHAQHEYFPILFWTASSNCPDMVLLIRTEEHCPGQQQVTILTRTVIWPNTTKIKMENDKKSLSLTSDLQPYHIGCVASGKIISTYLEGEMLTKGPFLLTTLRVRNSQWQLDSIKENEGQYEISLTPIPSSAIEQSCAIQSIK